MRAILLSILLVLTALPAWAAGDTGTLTADGSTRSVSLEYPHIHASGSFGGGTLTCYYADNDGNSTAISDAVFTSADDVTLDFPRAKRVWCTLAGSTTPSMKWAID